MQPGEQLFLYVVGFNIYALGLIYLRGWLYQVPVYRPMVLNFFLSVLPLGILLVTLVVAGLADELAGRWAGIAVAAVGLLAWLLALPNASYLITELNLNHRREDDSVPLWYDIIAVLSFAMSGVVNTVFNVLLVQIGFVVAFFGDDDDRAMEGAPAAALAILIIAAVSVGIYLGRYLRLNSWDVRSPRRMWTKVATHFDSWSAVGSFALFTAMYTIFLGLMYGLIVGPLVASITLPR
ncbi:DUF1361 domain-containing protein [Nocardia camponoti]|uniref:DUF1361 domain-containing protein n=1 Tax=Nocardia camponoti TaxID=1616106 RepID=A0A917V578_9NOCA|nr:DUF1361 domain-containing protein [Nocardia camponoti]GGK38342.1 hypothetical protein GCM10011591_07520 [Nocardia camponoti]